MHEIPDQFVEKRRLHDVRELARRDAVERMWVHVTGRIPTVEDLQTPRHRGFPAVELLVEIVPEPADGLRQDDSRGNRVAEGRQRNPATPAADPRADAAEGHRAPDAQAAVPDSERCPESGSPGAPIGLPIGSQVIQPAAQQSERHSPQRDVVDHAALTAARLPAPVADHQRGDDADNDEQRVRANGQRPKVPDAPRRAGEIGGQRPQEAAARCRTPMASSSVSARNAGRPPSLSADTSAEPTMTPSA